MYKNKTNQYLRSSLVTIPLMCFPKISNVLKPSFLLLAAIKEIS